MTDLRHRSAALELMDTEAASYAEFAECLRHLGTINRFTFAYRPTLRWLDRLVAGKPPETSLNILDVGSGHGDMLRRIAAWAAVRGIAVRLTGLDANPMAARAAAAATPEGLPIRYVTGDVFAYEAEAVDVVISSLFAHHLADDALAAFLRWMGETAREGWFVNDLRRHPLPFHAVRLAARWLPVNRMVKHDAPLSVARAFDAADWERAVRAAGLEQAGVMVERWFPFRYGVGWRR